jgi:hypothetical protein
VGIHIKSAEVRRHPAGRVVLKCHSSTKCAIRQTPSRCIAVKVDSPSRAEPKVRIHLPPAESQQRTVLALGFECIYQPQTDKDIRMHAQTAMIDNGFVYLPKEAAWLAAYLHELTAFPKGKHDHQADSTAQMLDWLKRGGQEPQDWIWQQY